MEAKELDIYGEGTRKLFYEDGYLQEFAAIVQSCEEEKGGYAIVLDQTAFFPEGGGQFGDVGSLNGIEVLDTREKSGVIRHITKEPLKVGETVEGKVDFRVRFDRMQQHTGEHMCSGIVHSLYGYDNVGFHLGADVTTMDFSGELTDEQVLEVENLVNQAVFDNLPVQILYPSQGELKNLDYRSKIEIEGQVRLVSIPGVDLCACCAPHTKNTGEVGLIKVISCDRHRGGCRVTIVCGMRALEDYRKKQASVTEVSVELSAPPEKIGAAVLHLKEQQAGTKEQLNRMQAVYLQQKLSEITEADRNVCIFEEELDNIAARNFVNEAIERCTGICGVFTGNDECGYRYILGSRHVDLRAFSKELNARFQGKGGGKPEMVQGSLQGNMEAIREMILEA